MTQSHAAGSSWLKRCLYLATLVQHNSRLLRSDRAGQTEEARRHIQAIAQAIAHGRRVAGVAAPEQLTGVRLLEIGCGQRCLAGLVLHSLGMKYCGIDLDVPSYRMTPRVVVRMLGRNGVFRSVKAIVRHGLFDRPLFNAYDGALQAMGSRLRRETLDIRTASAESIEHWTESFDVIYSHNVFEHIPGDLLPSVIKALFARLAPGGCAVIHIDPFPGICGGHLPEWYAGTLQNQHPRRVPAWEHLRNPDRGTGDTYLNRLRHTDYLRLFSAAGRVIAEFPDELLGKPFLTESARTEFAQYPEAELCATGWNYVLQRSET